MADMDNESWQMNVEELLALQSILQSSLVCFVDGTERVIDDATAEQLMQEGCLGRRLSCEASVHPCLPDGGLTVEVKASLEAHEGKINAEQSQAAATSHVQHLPPICLDLTFHDEYPQQDPPGMQLEAEWLSSEQADSLAQALLGLWREHGLGGPICFTWADWLQNDALPFLGITETLLLTFKPHAAPADQSSSSTLAAEEQQLQHDSCQSTLQAPELAPCSKRSAGSLKGSSSAGEQLACSSASLNASDRAFTACDSHADTVGPKEAGRVPSKQVTRTANPGEHVSARQCNVRQPGKHKHSGLSRKNPAKVLDPRAAVWQPSDGIGASSSLDRTEERQLSHPVLGKGPAHVQQSMQALPSQAAASPASVLGNGRARLSENTSSKELSAEGREDEHVQSRAASGASAGSSTARNLQPRSSGSNLERVVQLYMHLTAYSKSRGRELFQEGQHTCSICMEELPGAGFVWPGDCDHASCRECVKQLCSLHVAEGALESLRCPDPNCKQPFDRQCLVSLLSEEQLQRWEDLELAQSLQRMPDCVHCPRCSSACLDDAQNCAQCAKCFFAFCSLCNESWHPGIECMGPETKLELLRRRMAGMSVSVVELRRKELEYMSLIRIQETSKRCPACGMAIQKSEGCNKMTCGSCGAFFCWRCNKQVDGYEHFRSGKCLLFEHGEIQRWELEFQVQIERAQAQARNAFWGDVGERRRSRACPSCGQANHKMNDNNHMRCWACTAHFCYLCRQTLRGTKGTSGAHFGKAGSGKCRQHSPD